MLIKNVSLKVQNEYLEIYVRPVASSGEIVD